MTFCKKALKAVNFLQNRVKAVGFSQKCSESGQLFAISQTQKKAVKAVKIAQKAVKSGQKQQKMASKCSKKGILRPFLCRFARTHTRRVKAVKSGRFCTILGAISRQIWHNFGVNFALSGRSKKRSESGKK